MFKSEVVECKVVIHFKDKSKIDIELIFKDLNKLERFIKKVNTKLNKSKYISITTNIEAYTFQTNEADWIEWDYE